jgi:hypothetical protein
MLIKRKEIIMGCESAAKVVSDIFGEAHVVASALGCAVASAVGPMFGVPIEYQSCFNTAEQATNFTGKMINFWNKHVGNGGPATVGPRPLTPNTDLEGMIPSQGERMFIMPYPLKKDTATLTITERDGKGKTSVDVCKYNESGQHIELASWMFNDTDYRKDKPHEVRTLHLKGVQNHVIVVRFNGQSLTNSLSYTLRLDV